MAFLSGTIMGTYEGEVSMKILIACEFSGIVRDAVSVISSHIKKPTQIIQPWQFGHGETKKTCLWLKNLKPLIPTDIVKGREPRIYKLPPSEMRSHFRSITYRGIANAMAAQWG